MQKRIAVVVVTLARFGRRLNRPNPIERPLDWNVESQSGKVDLQPRPEANCSRHG